MFFNKCFENDNVDSCNMQSDGGMMRCCDNGSTCPPVMECPQERVCHRQMCYEVPQVSPFM